VPANDCVRPCHLATTHWVALPQLETEGGLSSWQDVSVRPEANAGEGIHPLPAPGFTIELISYEVLEQDFEGGGGAHPRELLPGFPSEEEVALDTSRMAVYTSRPFTPAQSLSYVEALMVEAGIPVASLKEVDRDEFCATPDRTEAAVSAGATVLAHTTAGGSAL